MNFKNCLSFLMLCAVLCLQHTRAMDPIYTPEEKNKNLLDFVHNVSHGFAHALSDEKKTSLATMANELSAPRHIATTKYLEPLKDILVSILNNSSNIITTYQTELATNGASDNYRLKKNVTCFNQIYSHAKIDEIIEGIINASTIDALIGLPNVCILKNIYDDAQKIRWIIEHDTILEPNKNTQPLLNNVPTKIMPSFTQSVFDFNAFIALCQKCIINENTIQSMQENNEVNEQWAKIYATKYISQQDQNGKTLQIMVQEYLKSKNNNQTADTIPKINSIPVTTNIPPVIHNNTDQHAEPDQTPDNQKRSWSMSKCIMVGTGIVSAMSAAAFIVYRGINYFTLHGINKNCATLRALMHKATENTLTFADYNRVKKDLTLVTNKTHRAIEKRLAEKSAESDKQVEIILKKELNRLSIIMKKASLFKRIAYGIRHDFNYLKQFFALLRPHQSN